jgi:hypothetical protein
MGHSKGTVTSRYIHAIDTALVMAADTVSGYINGLLNGVQFKRTSYTLDRASREATLARLCQHASRVQIGLVADHGGEDESRNWIDERNSPFSVILFREDFNQSIDQHVEEMGGLTLVDQYHAGRKLLQQGRRRAGFLGFALSSLKTAAKTSTEGVLGPAATLPPIRRGSFL